MHTYMRKTCLTILKDPLRSSKIRQWAVRILSLISMFILICHMTLVVDQNNIRSSNMNNLVLDFCQQSPLKKEKKRKKRKRKKEKKEKNKQSQLQYGIRLMWGKLQFAIREGLISHLSAIKGSLVLPLTIAQRKELL